MPATDPENLDRVFAALSHPVRRAILEQCGSASRTVVEIAKPHAISLNAVSKHIKTLESAGLIARQKDGNFHRIQSRPAPLKPALDWLSHHGTLWEQSLRSLKATLERHL